MPVLYVGTYLFQQITIALMVACAAGVERGEGSIVAAPDLLKRAILRQLHD